MKGGSKLPGHVMQFLDYEMPGFMQPCSCLLLLPVNIFVLLQGGVTLG